MKPGESKVQRNSMTVIGTNDHRKFVLNTTDSIKTNIDLKLMEFKSGTNS